MADYLVIKRETCGECDGAGRVQHGLWARFFRQFGYQWPELEEERRYWAQFGVTLQSKGGRGLPPEEVPCIECDGAGVIESRVTLAQALAAMQGGDAIEKS